MALLGITDGVSGTNDTQTCNYAYDDLARLTAADCGSKWSQTFTYDPFGNISAGGSLSFGASYVSNNTTNNRIVTDINVNGNYDADGDLRNDPVAGATVVNTFDAEGRPVLLEGASATYDALGRVVEAAGNEFLYAPDGRKIAKMSGPTALNDYIALPGGGAAVYANGSLDFYMHADWQGSARLETGTNGSLYGAAAYTPYGYVYDAVGSFEPSFTGQRQDIDSSHSGGQYSFPMRAQNPTQGRWWTPDPAGLAAVSPANPQSWNRYAYVGGQPLSNTDPLGLTPPPCQAGVSVGPDCVVTVTGTDPGQREIYCYVTGACPGEFGPPEGNAGASGGGGGGNAPKPPMSPGSGTLTQLPGSIASTCQLDPTCYFFVGLSGGFVNNSGKDLAIGLTADAVGAFAGAASAADSLAPALQGTATQLLSSAGSAFDTAAAAAQEVSALPFRYPEIAHEAFDAISQLAHSPGLPETAAGAAVAIGQELASHWDQITEWLK